MPYVKNDPSKIYDFFKASLEHCGVFLLDCSDEDVGWHLFEEFDGDCISFLHEDILSLLCSSGKISRNTAEMSLKLSLGFRALEGTTLWNIPSVRTDIRWKELFLLADAIKKSLRE